MSHSPYYAPKSITPVFVRRRYTISNHEYSCPSMISNSSFLFLVRRGHILFDLLKDGSKQISIKNRRHILHAHHEAFESHACIHARRFEWLELFIRRTCV